DAGADKPICVCNVLVIFPLLNDAAKDIRNRFVEGATLVFIHKAARYRVLRHAVGEFMGNDIEGTRKSQEDFAIAVAIDHLLPVPERVVVVTSVMDAGI